MIELRKTPWTRPSHDNQRVHAILHAVKAAGKLASILESEAHGNNEPGLTAADQPRYAADLVISAIRLADVCCFDLESAVRARQEEKNA